MFSHVILVDDAQSDIRLLRIINISCLQEFNIYVPDWEKSDEFNPEEIVSRKREHPTWTTLGEYGSKPTIHADGQVFIDSYSDLLHLSVRNPDQFVSGEIHKHKDEWLRITQRNSDNMSSTIQNWVSNGIDVRSFLRPFKGNFKGQSYDNRLPPKQYFQNSKNCKNFVHFIRKEISERLVNGSLRLWGRVGTSCLPKIIMPLTVEPNKPRLCHDERFLNLWTKDLPFTLDTLKDAHRLVGKHAYMVCCDEKSGYDHIKLTRESEKYFGIQFGGWVFTYTTLPFGWKASPYIYQMIGMQITSYLRKKGLHMVQYIDDRLAVCQKYDKIDQSELKEQACPLQMVKLIVTELTALGYTLAIKKCQLIPTTVVRYLGFLVDSSKQAYLLPLDKKEAFIGIREGILQSDEVDVQTLQRFAGKCISMAIVIPGAKLYTREINFAISLCIKNSKQTTISRELRQEIEHWRFLDDWEGFAPWRQEKHLQMSLSTVTVSFRYGISLMSGQDKGLSFGDYWSSEDDRPIHLKEASAVDIALQSLAPKIKDYRLDIHVDNTAVLHAWENQRSRDRQLADIMKNIFQTVWKLNIDLRLHYVPSAENVADAPSRTISYTDCMLHPKTWQSVDVMFGPHTVDLMATDTNVMMSNSGVPLKHFTKNPTPQSAGVNVFAQDLSSEKRPYVFPPFHLVFPVLCLLKEQKVENNKVNLPAIEVTTLSGLNKYDATRRMQIYSME
ncbi:uncharacterized protein LOC133172302 [Saccostrea echinata]|uniref:uncharacterized protein LOC133172302 n=1 Tax=Saccostrea echinata TaxID=191078 RepID=UPI002A811E5D|nr:uncharacterized protein LOC133172302 [Saccostrea echinata]